MAAVTLKCPKCNHRESTMMSRPHDPPPCPRCPTVVRMVEDVPPPTQAGGQTSWSSGGGPR